MHKMAPSAGAIHIRLGAAKLNLRKVVAGTSRRSAQTLSTGVLITGLPEQPIALRAWLSDMKNSRLAGFIDSPEDLAR